MVLRRWLFAAGLISLALLCAPGGVWAQDDKDKPTAPAGKDLKQRLKELEGEAGKIRQAMLKEIDAEAKKIDDGIKKAHEEEEKANKAKDRAAAVQARETAMKLRHSQIQLNIARGDIERRFNIGVPAVVKTPTEEERLGIHATVPSATLVNQLGLTRVRSRSRRSYGGRRPARAKTVDGPVAYPHAPDLSVRETSQQSLRSQERVAGNLEAT